MERHPTVDKNHYPPHSRCSIIIHIAVPLKCFTGEWCKWVVAVSEAVLPVEWILQLEAQTSTNILRLPLRFRVVLKTHDGGAAQWRQYVSDVSDRVWMMKATVIHFSARLDDRVVSAHRHCKKVNQQHATA